MSFWSKLYMFYIKGNMQDAITSLRNNPELIQSKKEVVKAEEDFSKIMVEVFGEGAKSEKSQAALKEFYDWMDWAAKEQIKRERARGYFRSFD